MYWKLSGMTGTAKTEEEEFYKVYWLETLVIPTNKKVIREDKADLLFKNEKWKFKYVVNLIKELHETWQPILVWTVSVEKSEYLSKQLQQERISHRVLNAKHHEKEAEIITQAGQKWAITIATNMAWRWTDIKLWEGIVKLGGLVILGTEKHETRRIDNQLRGRAWRQWDPWVTQFLISPNDDIMRIFGWDKLFSVFNSPIFASLPDNEPLTQSGMLTRKVTWVQKQVEWHNFDIRKHILEYDDVINKHRDIIYSKRNKILDTEDSNEMIDKDIKDMISSQITKIVIAEISKWENNFKKDNLIKKTNDLLWIKAINNTIEIDDIKGTTNTNKLSNYIIAIAIKKLDKLKNEAINIKHFYNLERRIVLSSIDELWMRHINAMSRLREEVAFEWYAQKNPLVVYKEKAFEKFKNLLDELEFKVTKVMFSINKITGVDSSRITSDNMKLNEINVEDVTKINAENNKFKDNTNPLFVNPNVIPNNNQDLSKTWYKKKIRI